VCFLLSRVFLLGENVRHREKSRGGEGRRVRGGGCRRSIDSYDAFGARFSSSECSFSHALPRRDVIASFETSRKE